MTTKIKRAMILAAGFGTRLGALTQITPKPLIEVGGQPILHRILQTLEERSFEEVVINTHYLAPQIQHSIDVWKKQTDSQLQIHISHEEHLLEIGGGLRHVLPYFKGEPFLVVNGDIVWKERRDPWLCELIKAYDAEKMDALLTLSPVENTATFREKGGDLVREVDGKIHFPKEGEIPDYVYAGIQILHPRLIQTLPIGKGPLHPAWEKAQNEGRFFGHIYKGQWADMGTPKGLEMANQLVVHHEGEAEQSTVRRTMTLSSPKIQGA